MFLERLKQLIKEKGITQKTFLSDVNLSKNNMRNWELNNTIPSKHVLDVISDYFGVSVDYLLGETDDRNDTKETAAISELKNKLYRQIDGLTDEQAKEIQSYVDFLLSKKKEDK